MRRFEEKWVQQNDQKTRVDHKRMVSYKTDVFVLTMCVCCVQVSDHGVLLIELGSGLSFPATEYLSHIIHTRALQGEDLCDNLSLCRGHLF